MSHLHRDWPSNHVWVVPTWQPVGGHCGTPRVPIDVVHGWQGLRDRLGRQKLEIVGLFFCRSSCWVPPHLDARFNAMVRALPLVGNQLDLPERELDEQAIQQMRDQIADVMRRQAEKKSA